MKTKVRFLVHPPDEIKEAVDHLNECYIKQANQHTLENIEAFKKARQYKNDLFKQADIFAYFPEEIADHKGNFMSYDHIGQHSACDPDYANESRPATADEYNDLKNELESIGYKLSIQAICPYCGEWYVPGENNDLHFCANEN